MVSTPYSIIWDNEALAQLVEILSFLEKESEQAPGIVKNAILYRLNSLKKNPSICETDKLKIPPDKNFRAFAVFSYRVTFSIVTLSREIHILRIRHTSREPLGY
jgi:plasmid stabilization system protein ParE